MPSRVAVAAIVTKPLLRVSGPVLVWAMFAVLLIPYVALRGLCDAWLEPRGLEGIERGALGFVPTRWLQERTYNTGSRWMDFPGFLLHLSWFFAPFTWGLVIAIKERGKLMEYYGWVLAVSYLSIVIFLLVPARPPWMEPGIHRILEERAFIEYTQVDDNQFAAFPSLHAGVPFVIALFYWFRTERLKPLAAVSALHGLLVSFAVVYLGEHWVLDVLGGWLLAGGVAALFCSGKLHRAMARVPGAPLTRVQQFNRYLMNAGLPEEDPVVAEVKTTSGSDQPPMEIAA